MNRDDLAARLRQQQAATTLYATGKGLEQPWGVSSGMADQASGRSISTDTPLRVASNTKTFVAATVLRLWEQSLIDLGSPIAPLITPVFNDLLSTVGYSTDKITVRHLLNHSGGLVDHAEDPRYFATVLADPARFWTRQEQVRLAAEYSPPLSEAGTRFSYSDTGYILLGDIIERISGTSLAATVRRELSFGRLGLTSTWWEIEEPQPPQTEPRARQFLGAVDATDISASMDLYGGGGLVMSARDLATFFAALFEHSVFDNPQTLAEMLSKGTHEGADSYRLGIAMSRVDGVECYSHLGFWGTAAYYAPASGVAIAGFATNREARAGLVSVIEQALAKTPVLAIARAKIM